MSYRGSMITIVMIVLIMLGMQTSVTSKNGDFRSGGNRRCKVEALKKLLAGTKHLDFRGYPQNMRATPHDGSVIISCKVGYKFETPGQDIGLRCKNGTWTKKPGTKVRDCVLIVCKIPISEDMKNLQLINDSELAAPLPAPGSTEYPQGKYKVKCALKTPNLDEVACAKTGKWDPKTPSCPPRRKCGDFQLPDNAVILGGSQKYFDGDTREINCKIGFIMSNSPLALSLEDQDSGGNTRKIRPPKASDRAAMITCGDDGKWKPSGISCMQYSCPVWDTFNGKTEQLSSLQDKFSSIYPQNNLYDPGSYRVSCIDQKSHMLRPPQQGEVGDGTVVCKKTSGGKWAFSPLQNKDGAGKVVEFPKCVPYCHMDRIPYFNVTHVKPDPIWRKTRTIETAVDMNDVNGNNFFVGDTLEVKCHPGYKLSPFGGHRTKTIVCEEVKDPNALVPAKFNPDISRLKCEEHGCIEPLINSSVILHSRKGGRYNVKETIFGSCPTDYHWDFPKDMSLECLEEKPQKGTTPQFLWTLKGPFDDIQCSPDHCHLFEVRNGKVRKLLVGVKNGNDPHVDSNQGAGATSKVLEKGEKVLVNQSVTVECNPGFKLDDASRGNINITCISDQWSGPIPSCIPTSCQKFSLKNGLLKTENASKAPEATKSSYANGKILHAFCEHRFNLYGSSQIECREGVWTPVGGSFPICEVKKCPPPRLPNAEDPGNTYYSLYSQVQIKCLDHYSPFPRGSSVKITCRPNGSWDLGDFKECRSTSCVKFSVPHGSVRPQPDIGQNMYSGGKVVQLQCHKGYMLEDPGSGPSSGHSVTCEGDSQEWSQIPACTRVPALAPIPNGKIIRNGSSEDSADDTELFFDPDAQPKVKCQEGFHLIGSSTLKFNRSTKIWTPSEGKYPYCEPSPDNAIRIGFFTLLPVLICVIIVVAVWFACTRIRARKENSELKTQSNTPISPSDVDGTTVAPEYATSVAEWRKKQQIRINGEEVIRNNTGEAGITPENMDEEVSVGPSLVHSMSESSLRAGIVSR